jgi:soluble lytic murein transglycosylase-like protein
MRRLTTLFGFLLLLVPLAGADGFSDYLKLRKTYGITQAVGVQTLETMLGTRTVEIQGKVKGTMTTPKGMVLMLERSDGDYLIIEAAELPGWLEGNEIPARLLVKATRASEHGELKARLIAAASEYQVAAVEAAAARAAAKRRPQPPARSGSSRKKKDWYLPASEVTPYYGSFIKKRNPRLSNAEALRIAQGVVGFSIKYGVDARLIMAMVMVESGFNPSATSHAGAMGLGQLMPGTARGMGVGNPYDSIDNLNGTVRLVRGHLAKYYKQTGGGFDALVLALAAYNAGGGAVKKYGGVPPYRETQNYVRKVSALYFKFCGR